MFKLNKNKTGSEKSGAGGRSAAILKYGIALATAAALFWLGFTCVVREGNCAVILRLGAVRKEITQAGLYLKLPQPFETAYVFDGRLQYLRSNRLETTTKDKRNVILQSYVVWKIRDPVLYYNRVGAHNSVEAYINDQVFSATNGVMGSYNLSALTSLNKDEIKIDELQREIFKRVKTNCGKNYGIEVADVSILTLSLPTNNLNSIFEQMSADRQKAIDSILANAKTQANKIRTDADAEAAKIKADGAMKAAEINAKTETEVAKIYARAQEANIELYKFLKELDTVAASVGDSSVLIVKADEYPFSALKKYSENLSADSDEVVVSDLNYILTRLPEEDRNAVIKELSALIEAKAESLGEA